MDTPKVSVIVPVYNTGESLRRCIESILNQTMDSIEIIVINDASENILDYSIIDELANLYPNITAVNMENNVPVGVARNIGMQLAKGDYIGFVDSDDYIDQHMYEVLVERIEKDGSDLAACRRIEFDRNGRMKAIGFRNSVKGLYSIDNNSTENQSLLMRGLTLFAWDKLYRREIIKSYGLEMASTRYAEDGVFVIKYIDCCKKVSFIDQPLYFYNCQSESGVTNNFSTSWLDIVPSMEILVDFYKKRGSFDDYAPELERIALGYYARRLQRMYLYANNRRQQMRFVKTCRSFFDKNYRDTKHVIRKLYPAVSKFYSPLRAYLYILRPNFLKINPRFLEKVNPKNLLKRFSTAGAKYAWYRNLLPVKSGRILFISNSAAATVDSSFYLMKDALRRTDLSLSSIVTPSHDISTDRAFFKEYDMYPKIVKWGSGKFARSLASSEYLVTTTILPTYFNKRPKQKVLNTWHGTPLKTLGYAMETPWTELANTQPQFLQADYLLYPNDITCNRIMSSYRLNHLFSHKVIISGYPRTEVFLNEQRRNIMRKSLQLDDMRSFAYMPTWRGNGLYQRDHQQYQDDLKLMLDELDRYLDDDVVVYVKLHRYMSSEIEFEGYSHIRQFDARFETYDFLNAVDGLITDYSSTMFDYAVTLRPIFLFLYDYDEYISERGVYEDPRKFPFSITQDTRGLAKALNSTDLDAEPSQEYVDFHVKYCIYDRPNNASILNSAFINQDEHNLTVFDYRRNVEKKWRIVFADNMLDKEDGIIFANNSLKEDDLLVFSKKAYSDKIEQWLRTGQHPCAVLIVPGESPKTPLQVLGLFLFSRTGKLGSTAKKFFTQELNRMLPDINIREIVNYADGRLFRGIDKTFGMK